jgi:hypothetical protein
MAQLADLGDHRADTITTLHAAYAIGPDDTPLDFVRIVEKLNEKAGTRPTTDAYHITDF